MRVSYKRAAVKDMEATRDYIAGRLKNPKAAKKLMTALLKAISLLVDNPYILHDLAGFRPDGCAGCGGGRIILAGCKSGHCGQYTA